MAIAHLLEDFGSGALQNASGRFMDEDSLEEFRLSSFEAGYAAGWEDSLAAQGNEHKRLSSSLATNLEDLAFTYQEALNQMTLSVEPIILLLLENVIPQIMRENRAQYIVEQLKELVAQQTSNPVRISVAIGAGKSVSQLIGNVTGMPVEVIENPSFTEEQAEISIYQSSRQIDTKRMLGLMSESFDAFFHQTRQEIENGRA